MKEQVEYGSDIVVGSVCEGVFRWHASEKELWILDQRKWAQAFISAGYDVSSEDYSERFGIAVLNEKTAPAFFRETESDFVTKEHLQSLLRSSESLETWDDFSHLMPSLYVDFDRRELISFFPEPLEFENYVPEGWKGSYSAFYERIPNDQRYWILDGVDLLTRAQPETV